MNKIPHIGFLIGLAISLMGLASVGADKTICLSIVIIVVGLLFLTFQTGPAAATTSIKSTQPTSMISSTVVNLDSKTRWRRKTLAEEELGLLLLIIGIVSAVIAYLAFSL